jgi:microcystin-dependent protein
MAGPLNFGNQKGQNLADPDLAQPTEVVNVRTLLNAIATSGASPVGVVMDFVGATAPTGWLVCDGSAYLGTAYPVLYGLLGTAYREGSAQGAKAASFQQLIAGASPGDISGSAIVTGDILARLIDGGIGYTGVPQIVCENTDGGAAVVTQPTFSMTVSGATVDGPNVTGGTITAVSVLTGGAGIRAGAVLRVQNALAATPTEPALAELPTGYFKVPDLRGRVTVGAGTMSMTPGIIDPPDITKGQDYNATPHDIGDYGGSEQHKLTIPEMPSHTHSISSGDPYSGADNPSLAGGGSSTSTGATGGSTAHTNMQPYHVMNKIIKAA